MATIQAKDNLNAAGIQVLNHEHGALHMVPAAMTDQGYSIAVINASVTRNGDGTINTVTVVKGGNTYIQTFSYTNGLANVLSPLFVLQ